jgi:hypothetical protein
VAVMALNKGKKKLEVMFWMEKWTQKHESML